MALETLEFFFRVFVPETETRPLVRLDTKIEYFHTIVRGAINTQSIPILAGLALLALSIYCQQLVRAQRARGFLVSFAHARRRPPWLGGAGEIFNFQRHLNKICNNFSPPPSVCLQLSNLTFAQHLHCDITWTHPTLCSRRCTHSLHGRQRSSGAEITRFERILRPSPLTNPLSNPDALWWFRHRNELKNMLSCSDFAVNSLLLDLFTMDVTK